MTDAILAEMHAIKDGNAQKYRGRFSALLTDLKKRQEASGRTIIPVKKLGRRGALKRKVPAGG